MNRTVTSAAPSPMLPTAPPWRGAVGALLSLSRHAVWMLALFVLLAVWVQVRLEVQQLRSDLDRNRWVQDEAEVLHDRLRLELDTRGRAIAMEEIGRDRVLSNQIPITHLGIED